MFPTTMARTGNPSSLICPSCPSPTSHFTSATTRLVVATQGRAFWILDDLPLLREMKGGAPTDDVHLFAPKETLRAEGGGRGAAAAQLHPRRPESCRPAR